MMSASEAQAARQALTAGRGHLVRVRRANDIETPVSAMLKLGATRENAFLLESVEGGEHRGRFSIIGLDPDLAWRIRDGRAEVARGPGAVAEGAFIPEDRAPLASLRALIAESALELPDDAPPPAAGLFGYLGYETVGLVERLPQDLPDPIGVPTAWLVRPSVVLVFDALRQELSAFAPVRPGPDDTSAIEAAQARIQAAFDALDAPLPGGWGARAPNLPTQTNSDRPRPVDPPEKYRDAVARAKGYVRAGDAFQVVPSQRFAAPFRAQPFALYRALRRLNPSPFLFFFSFSDFAVVGSSPEILVRVRDGHVTVRPIAGTKPRGATPEEDAANAEALLADPKERAEHLMLIDLGRNDVGRVANPGSVRVTESFSVERYSHVMHLESNVVGTLSPHHDALDALLAGFPAGTVSGAPKVRAMEIIAELERERRGVYAGAVGYFSASGELDTCIALRTAVVKDGMLHVRAGAGVVFDSDPETERLETEHKAAALFRAAAEASAQD